MTCHLPVLPDRNVTDELAASYEVEHPLRAIKVLVLVAVSVRQPEEAGDLRCLFGTDRPDLIVLRRCKRDIMDHLVGYGFNRPGQSLDEMQDLASPAQVLETDLIGSVPDEVEPKAAFWNILLFQKGVRVLVRPGFKGDALVPEGYLKFAGSKFSPDMDVSGTATGVGMFQDIIECLLSSDLKEEYFIGGKSRHSCQLTDKPLDNRKHAPVGGNREFQGK
jgi:hypothetical protein